MASEGFRKQLRGIGWTSSFSVRRGLFTLIAVVTLGLAALMMRAELLLAFTGWFENLGIHQVHDMTIFGLLWITIVVPMVLAIYRPVRRVNTVFAPLLFLVPMAVFAALANSPLLMLPVIFGTLGLLTLVFHPAGRDLLRFDRVNQVSWSLTVLLVIAAVPLLLYAGGQALLQVTVTDEHALFAHYGGMAIAATYVIVMGALAVFRRVTGDSLPGVPASSRSSSELPLSRTLSLRASDQSGAASSLPGPSSSSEASNTFVETR